MLKRVIGICILLFFVINVDAQRGEEVLTPIHYNPALQQAAKQEATHKFIRKTGIKDTLQLPFFDDFSTSEVFPNENRWTTKDAYINTDFTNVAPSLGVATLDGLDSKGRPYFNIRAGVRGGCDTLTSQPIDLSALNVGSNVYLSFFYQPQGLNFFPLTGQDSLVLQFKDNNGFWFNEWVAYGSTITPFKAVIEQIDSAKYFHAGFQFRFINYQEYLGGVGQWHVDYVYLERNRTANDTVFSDVAVAKKPNSFLKEYQEMPYEQFKGFENNEIATSINGSLSNMGDVGRTVDVFNREVRDQANNLIINSPRSGLAIGAKNHLDVNFSATANTTTFNTDTVTYTVSEYLQITGANFRTINDSTGRELTFANYYAYDDGTAETGYGLRRGKGKIAYKFRVNKPDSLRAISVYFFQAEDTVKRVFNLSVWNSIEPNGFGENLAYQQAITYPDYTDSINGFHTYLLDSAIAVADSFYIGWEQNTEFFLNIGWDRNYSLDGDTIPNPGLYFNSTGKWYTSFIPGTLMMRPHLGKDFTDTAVVSVKEFSAKNKTVKVYPNPANNHLWIEIDINEQYDYSVTDVTGKTVVKGLLTAGNKQPIDISYLTNGLYFINLHNPKLGTYQAKFIKQ
jgi:hypothetical protein